MLIHVVSHTHWDREWYQPAGRFRQRLVPLIDELLDEPPPDGASFLLDGQAVVLQDYLAMRPERSAELSAALRRGALEAGPWLVLADELIPGGEALVRNLLAGRRVLRAMRAEAPPVLYCPDAFGHPAALPELARGFGFEMVVAWRGYGGRRWPSGDAVRWRAPSGATVLLYHLPPSGYEAGASLSADQAEARARWEALRPDVVGRARLGVVLLPNGADHHARQRDLGAAVAALRRAAAPEAVQQGSLAAFAALALEQARAAPLDEVSGELRDSYGYTWTLGGTLATRAYQKRNAATLERLLVREVEPWAALAARRSGVSRRSAVQAAWHELLLCHPHDTLCGCSTDQVARAFDARIESGMAQAAGVRDDALAVLTGHDAEAARRQPDAWRPHLVLRNPAPQPRRGVAIVTLTRVLHHVAVGPGSPPEEAIVAPRDGRRFGRRVVPRIDGVMATQVLAREQVHERLESPRAYPYDDLVERTTVAISAPEVAGFEVRALAVGGKAKPGASVPYPVRAASGSLTNGLISVDVSPDGTITVQNLASGRRMVGFVTLEDQDDAGDLYTPSLRGEVRVGKSGGAVLRHKGPLVGAIETRWQVPVRYHESATAAITLMLYAGSPIIRVFISGANAACDHRLRVRFATGIQAPTVRADAAFGPLERRPLVIDAEDAAMEVAPPTAPLHRYVTLSNAERGATVISDGLAEYEGYENGNIAITLVRAVGELSRSDLPERPGHAGWPAPVPGAQCPGAFGANFAVWFHGAWSEEVVSIIERMVQDVLTPVTGTLNRWLLDTPPDAGGLTLHGRGLVFSAARESEDGDWLVLRCVNVFDRAVTGRWEVAGGLREARASRLDETPGAPIPVEGAAVAFEAPARGVVTILVR